MAYNEDVNVNLNVLTGTIGGITAIMGGMSALTSSFGAMGTAAAESFGTLDGLLVTSTALIASFGLKSAEAFGEFEQGMKIVQTVSNQTGAAINELSNKANELSIEYRTAIGDITTGLQTLGRAGLNSAQTQMEVLETGLQTAKLEGRNLNGVLEEIIQNTAMLGGDLKSIQFGEQSEYLNSLMVGTSMTAPINSHDISQTLQYAGGTAAAAGANLENKDKLEDLMGTVAAFAQKGVKGSMAGTALRAFFTKPASQDKSVTEGLASIGLSPEDLWEDGGNSMKKVSDQVGIIKRQMDSLNLSTMEQVEIWGKIVGPKMGQQMMKLDSTAIKDLTRDIESAQSAEDLATKTLQTYTQKLAEMQQQGELAFREFGEKAVVFLTPVIEVLTKILGIFSTREGSLAGFMAIGALLSHGITKAWGMATALYNEIKGLISNVVAGIEQINATAGGSSAGFAKSAEMVDFLNSKLAYTNTQLSAMQAQFLGLGVSKTGTGVMPLGIVGPNGRVPSGLIGYADQKVFRGDGVLGQRGALYDPSETKKLEDAYRSKIMTQNAENQALRERYSGKNALGNMTYIDPRTKLPTDEKTFNKALPIISEKDINKNIERSLGAGKGTLHSGLMSMTEKEYKAFMKDLKTSSERLMNPNNYKNADGTWDNKKYRQDQLRAFNLQRQQEFERNAAKEGNIHRSTVGGQQFYRVNKLFQPQERMYEVERAMQKQAQLKQFEQQRASVINQQQALAGGRAGGLINKSQQIATQRLQAYSGALSRNIQRLRSFGTSISTAAKRFTGQLDLSAKAMSSKMDTAIANVSARMEEAPITFEEALIQIQEELGVTSAELNAMFTETELGLTSFNEKLIALGLTTVEGEVATTAHTGAVLADTAATEKSMLAKLIDGAKGALTSFTGFMGGPLMAGMMGFMVVMQGIQKSQQDWQEKMQEATNQLSEATDRMSESSDKIKEIYSAENPNMTEADLDKAVDMQYGSIYDSFYTGVNDRSSLSASSYEQDVSMKGKENEETGEYEVLSPDEITELNENVGSIELVEDENTKALKENTMQLMSATAAYNQAQNKQVEGVTDWTWGFDSIGSDFTDALGEWQEEIWNTGAWIGLSGGDARKGFLDSNSPILTGSQADSNYGLSTDFSGIFAADIYRFDNENLDYDDKDRYTKSLEQFFGSDFDRIIGLMNSMDGKISSKYGSDLSGSQALYTHAANMAAMDEKTMAYAQVSLKDNTEDYQKLGKQMYRYEQSQGFDPKRTAYGDYADIQKAIKAEKLGDTKSYNEAMKRLGKNKLTVQDRNLDNTIKKLMALTGNKLTEQNILAMGQLQQLQDMNQIANEQVAPGIMQTVQAAYNNVSATGAAADQAGSAAGGAVSAANNAAAIATLLGAQAQETSEHAAYLEYTRTSEEDLRKQGLQPGMDETRFRQQLADLDNQAMEHYRQNVIESLTGAGWSVNNPEDATPENIKSNASRLYETVDPEHRNPNASYQDILNTVTAPLVNYAQGAIMAAYDQSSIGEYGGGQRDVGSGGGSGGGDGSDKSDKDKGGTRKERVDLVLCNKKEIPKLNVNLFKKPPNFTVLNKNFKLRDIKINSQDKPKAIMNAIKNGIIETQKRMDPKIIQDEAGEYNPLEATEGSPTPSGTTETTT